MNKIKETLMGKKSFVPFITAGDPSLDKTEEFGCIFLRICHRPFGKCP